MVLVDYNWRYSQNWSRPNNYTTVIDSYAIYATLGATISVRKTLRAYLCLVDNDESFVYSEIRIFIKITIRRV